MEKDIVVTQLEHSEKEVAEEVVDDETEVEEEVQEETAEDTKVEDDSAKEQTEKPKKQTSSERKRYAEMRRAKEAKEREDAIKKAKQEGIIEGLGGTNPYTGEKIVDNVDFELYQEMKDAESKGYNPNNLSDMLKYRKEVRQEALKAEEAKNESNKKTQDDINEFMKSHPDVDVKELLEDEAFGDFAKDMLGIIPLATIYAKYNYSNNVADKKAKDIAIKEKARRESSVGSLSNGDSIDEEFSIEQIQKMSREEIDKNYDKIMKNYFKK